MGACDFRVKAKGTTAKEAFQSAVEDARAKYGNRGYTGSIAEKHDFQMDPCPAGRDFEAHIEELIEENDKWGPASCVPVSAGEWLFVGMASS